MATLKLCNQVLGRNNPAIVDLAHYVCNPTGIAGFDTGIFMPAMSATLNRQPDMAKSNSKGSQSPASKVCVNSKKKSPSFIVFIPLSKILVSVVALSVAGVRF